jgi:release factor glutamine methyltransferase
MLLIRSLSRRVLVLQRKFSRVDLSRPRLHDVHGTPLLVLPHVFDGVLIRTGVVLVETLKDLDLQNARVLDLGCGSGIGAVFAAQRGAYVIASDLNPEAARNTKLNALLSRHEQRIETRGGDLFETVRGERFDLILFNPPYYHGAPRDGYDAAWRSRDSFERFLEQFPNYLTPNGRARIVLSTDGEIEPVLSRATHLKTEIVRRRDLWNEILTVYDLHPKR